MEGTLERATTNRRAAMTHAGSRFQELPVRNANNPGRLVLNGEGGTFRDQKGHLIGPMKA